MVQVQCLVPLLGVADHSESVHCVADHSESVHCVADHSESVHCVADHSESVHCVADHSRLFHRLKIRRFSGSLAELFLAPPHSCSVSGI